MAISTVASDEAKYKKMLGNWAVSMALVFVLHFIIIATLYVNNKLVGVLYEFSGEVDGWDYAAIAAEGLVPVVGIGEAITFALMLGMEFNFVLIYIKRVITLAFLIVIAPLITITYSIDKIKDNRSQALDTWLKEYMFTVLIQPFHCIIYIVIIQTALKGMSSINIGTDIIYIIMLKFMKDAEEIVRKIFGIRSDSLPGFKASGAMALGVMSKLGSSAGKGGGKSGGGSGKESKVPNFKKEQKSADAAANAAQRGANARNPQIPGQGGNNGGPQGGNNGGPQGGNNQPPAPQPQPQDQNNQPSRMERVINSGRDIANKVGDTEYGKQLKGIVNRRGGVKNIIQSGAKHGAQLAGFGFGLGLTGEIDQAAGFSMLAGNTTESIEGAIDNYYDNKKLDSNEEVIKNDLVQLIDDKNVGDDPVERQKEFDDFIDKFDKWSKGDLQLSAFDPAERTLIEERIEPQIKGWAERGESDPYALMKGLIEKTAKEDKKRHRN